ncbi:MAG: hypothetical protein CEE43_12875 [Promethearchaeota archaeon Loki_b32]|nr:MAG: hypothetical protein CEE43_12875 [Candidatus Lokiarchaeota archaeon Loki_b32]
MVIHFEGILDGTTATLIILSSTIFGLLSLYKSIKLKAKLLTIAALMMFFVGCLWLGPTVDFFMVLLSGENISPIEVYSLLSYLWVAPALIFAIWLGGELIFPKRKWIFVGIFIVLGVIFEYFLWFQTDASFTWELVNPGEDLIDAHFVRTHPTFLMIAVFLVSALVFLGIGFAIKAKQSTGQLRRKFTYLSIGNIIFVLCGALDSILTIPLAIGVVRIVMATFALWMYLGLKT